MADSDPLNVPVSPARPARPAPPVVPDHEMIRRIGGGSYGEVWLARSIMGTYRAVKVVYRETFDNERPFEREFTGIQKFEPISRSHESQVDILHVGKGEGYFYYVMELADDAGAESENMGKRESEQDAAAALPALSASRPPAFSPANYVPRTLKLDLSRRGKLPFDECLHVSLSLTTALEHLHKHGLVHRDIKPANIIFVHGVPKLADIGLVTSVDATFSYVGTEGYLPPEGPGTPQADIYSLGKVLYEISTGLDRQEFPDLPTNLAELPERESLLELNAIIAKACHSNPTARYQSAVEMNADLLLLQSGKSVRRIRSLELRLARATKIGIGIAALGAVMVLAFLYQQHQTRTARRLADEHRRLAVESTERLVRLNVHNGVRLMDEGNLSGSLLWFAEAWKGVENDPVQNRNHRLRFEFLLRECPRVEQIVVHKKIVNWCEFSPDGTKIVTASGDATAQVWDAATGEPIGAPMQHKEAVLVASFSADGKRIVTASLDGTSVVWDASNGRPVAGPLVHAKAVQHAAFSPDSQRVVTASQDGTARVWDASTGQPVTPPLNHETNSAVWHAVFSPDGRSVVTSSADTTARIWHAVTGEMILPPLRHADSVAHAEFSPDGTKIVTACGTPQIKTPPHYGQVWSARTGEALAAPLKHDHYLTDACFSPDGRRVLTSSYGSSRIWDSRSGEPVTPFLKASVMRHAAFSPDGQWAVTSSENDEARIWNAESGELVVEPLKHGAWVYHAAFSPDGTRVVTGSDDHTARIWSLIIEKNLAATEERKPGDSKNRRLVGFHLRNYSAILEGDTGQRVDAKSYGIEKGNYIAWSSDFKRLLVLDDSTATRVWDVIAQKPLTLPLENKRGLKWADFAPDGTRYVICYTDGSAQVWEGTTNKAVGLALVHTNAVIFACFSPDGKKVATISGSAAFVWDVETGRPLFAPLGHEREVNRVEFSPDGTRIATASRDQTGRVWDATTGKPITPPLRNGGNTFDTGFSPNGRLVVTAGLSGHARVWDAVTGELVLPPLKNSGHLNSFAFSEDCSLLATCSDQTTACLWDIATGDPLTPFLKHHNSPFVASFSPGPNPNQLFTTGLNLRPKLWQLKVNSYPREDLLLFAQLFSGHRIAKTGSIEPVRAEDLLSILHTLRAKYPDEFRVPPATVLARHIREAAECEDNFDWATAIWHLNQLLKAAPDDPTLHERLGEAHAILQHWPEALTEFAHIQEPRTNYLSVVQDRAVCAWLCGATNSYQKDYSNLFNAFRETKEFGFRLGMLCALDPAAIADHHTFFELLRGSTNAFWEFRMYAALALYQEGQYQQALEELAQLPQLHYKLPLAEQFEFFPGFINLLKAQVNYKLGDVETARSSLKKVNQWLEERDLSEEPWKFRLILCIQLREAEALILGKERPDLAQMIRTRTMARKQEPE